MLGYICSPHVLVTCVHFMTVWFLKLCLRRISAFLTTCAKFSSCSSCSSPFLYLVMLSISVTFWASMSSSEIVVFATTLLSSPDWTGLVMIESKFFLCLTVHFFRTNYVLKFKILSHTAKSLFFSTLILTKKILNPNLNVRTYVFLNYFIFLKKLWFVIVLFYFYFYFCPLFD